MNTPPFLKQKPRLTSIKNTCRTERLYATTAGRHGPLGAPRTLLDRAEIRLMPARSQVGVTLIELMVSLAVLLILIGVGVPSFQNVIRTNRIAAFTNELSAALQLARSHAVTRSARVTVCKSTSISDTNPTCDTSNNNNWHQGWLVFVDLDQDGDFDSGETLLRVAQPSAANATVSPTDDNFQKFIGFTPTGESRGSGTTSDIEGRRGGGLSITLGPDQRCIAINRPGRLLISKGTCS